MKLMPSLRTSAARAQQLHCEHFLPAQIDLACNCARICRAAHIV